MATSSSAPRARRKFVAHLERTERQPSLHTLLRIGRGLGLPAADLVAEVERDLSE